MKYEILENDHKTFVHPHTEKMVRVYRIIYVKDVIWINPFTDERHQISAGSIGGFVQNESNLSHEDTSIILNNSMVFGNARLFDSMLRDSASVFDEASITSSDVFGNPRIFARTNAKNCIFRDHCNVGGMLTMERCYIANSANISGINKIYDTEMRIGSIIRGQCNIYNCQLTDVSEICGVSTVRNCRLSGRAFLKNVNIQNQSFNESVLLSVTERDGDLFPH